jgi:hypothetical protein
MYYGQLKLGYDLVHYSRNKYKELRPLTYEELVKDRTSGRWENNPEMAQKYVQDRIKTEHKLHNKLKSIDRNKTFLYATIAGHEQYGKGTGYKHIAPLTPEIIDQSFFDVVGDNGYKTIQGQKGLEAAIARWNAAKANNALKEEEYMGMRIRPRIEVMTPNTIVPSKIQKLSSYQQDDVTTLLKQLQGVKSQGELDHGIPINIKKTLKKVTKLKVPTMQDITKA